MEKAQLDGCPVIYNPSSTHLFIGPLLHSSFCQLQFTVYSGSSAAINSEALFVHVNKEPSGFRYW